MARMSLSNRTLHFFHVLSNVRPIIWIGIYIGVTPLFALAYWLLPEGQFRIPDAVPMDFGSCLYYSIVTITTLGFGDYTPTHAWSQSITACEVMTGLIVLGLFLNAVGSMKSEIDITSEIEKQRMLHFNAEKDKLIKNTPIIIHHINAFLSACYFVTTPVDKRHSGEPVYNPDFSVADMVDLYSPSPVTGRAAIDDLISTTQRTSLYIDSVQNRIDITLWPDLLEDFFSFVANAQMFEATDLIAAKTLDKSDNSTRFTSRIVDSIKSAQVGQSDPIKDVSELYEFIKKNADIAMSIESALSKLALES